MEAKLTELVGRLKEAAGKNLESIILYGSAARGDYQPGTSDLNILCTLVTMDVAELRRLAPVMHWWRVEMHEPMPLFMLTEELRQSTDVFAIESLDAKRSHRVLFGPDVVADLDIPMNLHRVEVERELRVLLQRMRQHLLHAGNLEADLSIVLRKGSSVARTLLRHTLLYFGEEPPASMPAVFARITVLTGADSSALAEANAYRENGVLQGDLFDLYGRFMAALEKVIAALDHKVPKHEWQRQAK